MPNKKGGKNYKKSKHFEDEPIMYELLPGQMYARVIKLVGGCNAIVYCNDGRERMVHIRGNMRKKVWIATGDIVLISLRELDNSSESNKSDVDRGDICAKYDSRLIYRLQQKDKNINPMLFMNIEKKDSTSQSKGSPDEDNGFVFDNENAQELETEDSEEEKPVSSNRLIQRKIMEDEINIDDI